MSVLGIDIGNAFCVVAAAGKGSVDVILNEESNRETPACVAIGGRQRFLGAAAASPSPGTTAVSQIKRLIGRPFRDRALQRDLKTFFPNITVSADADGYPLLHFPSRDSYIELSPTQLLGMLLGSLKRSAERHLSTPVSDCCIAIPAHFNHVQSLAILHAAEIAGLCPRRLLHECSAAALEYGIYRGDFPADRQARPHVAAFVDVGHSATQVAIVEFRAKEVRIVAQASDPDLGGRDFDEVLFRYFSATLKDANPKLDISGDPRASTRLRTACEKVKKVLSVNPEAPLYIECLMPDEDASGLITRNVFERICGPLLEKLKRPLQKALQEAALKPEDVEIVELIGSGSRVPAVVRVVKEVFGQEPRRTLNAKECVARGCAHLAATLSPYFDFEIQECVPCSIDISWKDSVSEETPSQKPTMGGQILTKKGYNMKEDGFSFDLAHRYATDCQVTATLGTYRVGPFNFSQNGTAKLKITFHLSRNGIVSLDSVTGNRPANTPSCEEEEVGFSSIEYSQGVLSMEGLKEAKRLESEMAAGDRALEDLKTYVYEMNRKLGAEYREFVSDAKRVFFLKKLQQAERLLYNEGDDVDRDTYMGKLNELKTHGDPIEMLFRERTEWDAALERLLKCLSDMEALVNGDMPESAHINKRGKKKIRNECVALNQWLKGVLEGLSDKPKHADQVFKTAEVQNKIQSLTSLQKLLTSESRWGKKCAREKYALGSYAYEMEAKLRGEYLEFVTEADRQYFIGELKKAVNEVDHDVEAADPKAYVSRLNQLQELGDPIEMRFREYTERPEAINQLRSCTDDIDRMFNLTDGIFGNAHSDNQGKLALDIRRAWECAVRWLASETEDLNDRPNYEDPVVRVARIWEMTEYLLALKRSYEEALTTESKSGFFWNAGLNRTPRGDPIAGNLPHLLPTQSQQVLSLPQNVSHFNGGQTESSNMQPLVRDRTRNRAGATRKSRQPSWTGKSENRRQ